MNRVTDIIYPDNGWTPYCGRVEVHEVPGDHDSMVLEPNVRTLAQKLRKCIAAAQTRKPSLVGV
jgi:thioesterase domain-containing protein